MSVLDKIEDQRVFSLEKTKDGYKFTEECDRYYDITLTQEQFEQLIKQLQAIAAMEKENK